MKIDTRNRLLLPILIPVGILAVIGLVLFGFSRILLSVKASAATATALAVALTVLAAAAIAAARERVRGSTIGGMVGTVAGVAMLAGGLAIVAIGPPEEEVPPFLASISAPVGAAVNGFDPNALSVPAGKPITLTFDNQDTGITHNVVIFDGEDATAPQLFRGTPVAGVNTFPYDVKPLPEGTYFFYCEFHPSTMTGSLTVTPAAGGQSPAPGGSTPPQSPGGGGGNAVSIQAVPVIKFSTSSLSWSADTSVTVTLDNQDPGQSHNFSLYRDEAHTDAIAKSGLVATGSSGTVTIPALPAGTYYFQCDVHPPPTYQMVGTVTVS